MPPDDQSDLSRIAADVQNIGRNCEYGMIQRRQIGVEPVSLLRWSGIRDRGKLVEAFRSRFEGLAEVMTGRPDPPGKPPEEQHWWLIDDRYDIVFHTECELIGHSAEEATAKVRGRFRRLAETLVEAVESNEKLFLYSDRDFRSIDEARGLFDALRSIGPAWLLVVIADAGRAGTAVTVEPGLIAGYVRSLTPMRDAWAFDFEPWPAMLRAAHALWLDGRSS